MSENLDGSVWPELIFGIAGPIGVDVDQICAALAAELKAVDYTSTLIKLTSEMLQIPLAKLPEKGSGYFGEMNFKMDYANAICGEYKDPAAMARIAMGAITRCRQFITKDSQKVASSHAYIVRQFKRPEEIELLRKVYGRQFILVSAYSPSEDRISLIQDKILRSLPAGTPHAEVVYKAHHLVDRDANEDANAYGQHLRDTFHLADVFIDGSRREAMSPKLKRFVEALFGKTDIAPSKEEYGMYAATSASLRSSDLSRQVGAAIFGDGGELITQGCNEVPKAFGGTYWDLEDPDYRDVKLGYDPNDNAKKEILKDLFDRLDREKLLSSSAMAIGTTSEMVEVFTRKKSKRDGAEDPPGTGVLIGAMILDLTEFGRVVHAEMCAICDAARLGRSLKGATLYCTTFPCHNCTKHILAAGIRRVVYMEPYPKSRAKQLHAHEIEIEEEVTGKVSFVPFMGISPFRYRDIFRKGKRKKGGDALTWYYDDVKRPMMDVIGASHIFAEAFEFGKLMGKVERNPSSDGTGAAH
jgi:cytidine deaminase